jgi:hypothetical protein
LARVDGQGHPMLVSLGVKLTYASP